MFMQMYKFFPLLLILNFLVLSLQELCCRTVVRRIKSVYSIDTLPLPASVKSHLKSYALSTTPNFYMNNNNSSNINNNVNSARNLTCKSPNSSKFSAKNNCCISWSVYSKRNHRSCALFWRSRAWEMKNVLFLPSFPFVYHFFSCKLLLPTF
jgi:hypothetical protein